MKIKILADLPVAAEVKPVVGDEYEVVRSEGRGAQHGGAIYFIKVGAADVGVFADECEVIE